MRHLITHVLSVLLAFASVASLAATSATLAQSTSRIFPETGKTVSGRFLEYWNTHGGLMQQGYPISNEMQEVSETDGKTYTVQYFERAVFEKHPENTPPNDVLLSLLGVFLYQQKYAGGAPGQMPSADANARLFPETGHKVGGLFLDYWNKNGGLAQQGYPISDEFIEKSDLDGKSYNVQYFQRAVFEHHPENAAPYNVLLSQLGTFRYRQKYGGTSSPTAPSAPASATTTPQPTATFTYTPVPPTETETNTPRPTKTPTPVPTACPDLLSVALDIGPGWGGMNAAIRWSVNGGGSEIRGGISARDELGRGDSFSISGRSGEVEFGPTCGFGYIVVTASISLHDECGQSGSAQRTASVIREPCR